MRSPLSLALASMAAPAVSLLVLALGGCERLGAEDSAHIDRLARLTLEEDLRIGDFADPSIGFSRPNGVDVDRDGNVYVVEGAVPEIRVFDPDGNFVRRFGRRGSGPGEFEGSPRFGVMGDTVWTVESRSGRQWRITLFDRSGNLLSTGTTEGGAVPLPGGMQARLVPLQLQPDGLFIGAPAAVMAGPDSGMDPEGPVPVPFVRFDVAGNLIDTIGWAEKPDPRLWRPPSQQSSMRRIEVGGRPRMVPSPPTTLPWWLDTVDGYVAVETPLASSAEEGAFTVTRVGLTGDTVYRGTIRYRPVPYTSAGLDSISVRAARGEPGGMVPFAIMAGGELPPPPSNWEGIARELRAAMDFPPFRLPIESAWLAQDEGIWLRLAQDDAPTAEYILLDPDGSSHGRLTLPSNARPVWHRGDTVWLIVPDEFDVPWLVRHTLEVD